MTSSVAVGIDETKQSRLIWTIPNSRVKTLVLLEIDFTMVDWEPGKLNDDAIVVPTRLQPPR